MHLKKPKKHTNALTWPCFWFFVLIDAIKFILLLIPALGELFDEVLSVSQIIFGGTGLYFSGFFREGPESINNIIWFMGLATADVVPIIDGFPFTSPAIYHRIRQTQKADMAAQKEYEKKLAVLHKKEQADRDNKRQAAQAAAQRAANYTQQQTAPA